MAILNLTPDSFYAGSRHVAYEEVCRSVECAISEGATIIDIGGYSSRPGAEHISVDEEWARVKMGLEAVRSVEQGVVVSIDTFRSEIVRRAYEEFGEVIVNDISAGELDEDMLKTVAELGLKYVAMHMRGTPKTMQQMTDYEDVVQSVVDYLAQRAVHLEAAGIARHNIILDPGFGFAKSVEQNYRLLARLDRVVALGYPVLVGLSRKSMIYKLLHTTPDDVLAGTVALSWQALTLGATIIRAHDVSEAVQITTIYDKGFRGL